MLGSHDESALFNAHFLTTLLIFPFSVYKAFRPPACKRG